MRLTTQAGSVPLDLIASIVLWAIVSTAVVTALVSGVRSARKTMAQAERRETLRAAAMLSAAELKGHAGGPAALRVGGSEVEYRARRWTGVTCRWASAVAGGLRLTLGRRPLFGDRLPLPFRDSALVWLEGYPADPTDGRWQPVLVVNASAATCPDGRPGWATELAGWPAAASTLLAHPGAPVIGFERAALRVYRAGDGGHWLGQATAGSAGWKAIQPIAGPFAASSGFAWRPDGRSVTIGLRTPGPLADSLETIVALRSRPGGSP